MQSQSKPRRSLDELLRAIETCPSIDKLFALVKNEHIVINMKSQQSASNIPYRPLLQDNTTLPLDKLRAQVRDAAIAMYQDEPITKLLKKIDTCPSIDKLFEIVKNEHIVIQMKSQQAASNIPFRPLPQDKAISPLDTLRAQVHDAAIAMYREAPMNRLLRQIDTCPSIDKLFEIVKNEHIVIQMKSQQAASNIPFRPLPQDKAISPLDTLRAQVHDAVVAMYKDRSKERLIRAIETCPSIDKLFELVKNEHIVIQMRSQSSASCLPQQRLSGDQLMPDSTPLERLKQQVLEAVIYGR